MPGSCTGASDPLLAVDELHQVARPDRVRQREQLAVEEPAAAPWKPFAERIKCSIALEPVGSNCDSYAFTAAIFCSIVSVMSTTNVLCQWPLLGVERERDVDQVRHAVRGRAVEPLVPLGELRVEPGRLADQVPLVGGPATRPACGPAATITIPGR